MKRKNAPLYSLIYSSYDTASAFAKQLGWSRQRLSAITTGKKAPSIKDVAVLADALHVSKACILDIFLQ